MTSDLWRIWLFFCSTHDRCNSVSLQTSPLTPFVIKTAAPDLKLHVTKLGKEVGPFYSVFCHWKVRSFSNCTQSLFTALPSACRCSTDEWKTLHSLVYISVCVRLYAWLHVHVFALSETVREREFVHLLHWGEPWDSPELPWGRSTLLEGKFPLLWKFHYKWPQWISCNNFMVPQMFAQVPYRPQQVLLYFWPFY